jgi:hypothetical protein
MTQEAMQNFQSINWSKSFQITKGARNWISLSADAINLTLTEVTNGILIKS